MVESPRVLDVINVRVQFSTVEDARRVVFLALEGLSPREQSRRAGVVVARLRDAGLLGLSVEQHYSAADAAALIGNRSPAWAVKHAKLGDFGPVACDGGDWLIPASGLNRYLADHVFTPSANQEVAA